MGSPHAVYVVISNNSVDLHFIVETDAIGRWCIRLNRRVVAYGDVDANGDLEIDSGELAWEIANISKESSREENYPLTTRRDSYQLCISQSGVCLAW